MEGINSSEIENFRNRRMKNEKQIDCFEVRLIISLIISSEQRSNENSGYYCEI